MVETLDCAVIGGGVAGLSCARRLSARGMSVAVLEAEQVLGGRLRTRDVSGYPTELGAQFLTSFYKETLGLLDEIGYTGIEKILLSVGIGATGSVVPVWNPKVLGPIFLRTPSAVGLAALDFARTLRRWNDLNPSTLWEARTLDDQSVVDPSGGEAQRVLGQRIYGPAMEHFLYWSPETTSKAFVHMLTKGALIQRGVFRATLGFADLIARLASGLDVRLGSSVASVERLGEHWVLATEGGSTVRARKVVIATPGPVARGLVEGVFEGAVGDYLRESDYSQTVVVSGLMQGFAGRFTTVSNFGLRPVRFSALSLRRVALGTVFGVFLSDESARRWSHLDDSAVIEEALGALRQDFGSEYDFKEATACEVHRWGHAVPRFPQGSLGCLSKVRSELDGSAFSMTLAGDYISGPFIEGAVESGLAAAARLCR